MESKRHTFGMDVTDVPIKLNLGRFKDEDVNNDSKKLNLMEDSVTSSSEG